MIGSSFEATFGIKKPAGTPYRSTLHAAIATLMQDEKLWENWPAAQENAGSELSFTVPERAALALSVLDKLTSARNNARNAHQENWSIAVEGREAEFCIDALTALATQKQDRLEAFYHCQRAMDDAPADAYALQATWNMYLHTENASAMLEDLALRQ